MATIPARKTVTTSATRLDAEGTDSVSGSTVVLFPQAAGTLILGGSGVTAGTGARLAVTAGSTYAFSLDPGDVLYGVLASGSLDVDVLGLGQ